jgi:hypothetical protein
VIVMAGHSRSKNGVASLAYDPAIHVFCFSFEDVDARHKAGHDVDGNQHGVSFPDAHRRHSRAGDPA